MWFSSPPFFRPSVRRRRRHHSAFSCAVLSLCPKANVAKINYVHMIQDIRALQTTVETKSMQLVANLSSPSTSLEVATQKCQDNANDIVKQWWTLPDTLVVK